MIGIVEQVFVFCFELWFTNGDGNFWEGIFIMMNQFKEEWFSNFLIELSEKEKI